MTYPYTPQLTRWRQEVGGVVRDCVEHEGKPLFVRREDFVVTGEEDADQRECVEIGGRVFPLVDETTMTIPGGGAVRCVEYSEHGEPLLLTVREGDKSVAEVVLPDGGVLREVSTGFFYDPGTGTVQHMVDVQGKREAFILLVSVSVREELGRIVAIKRLN
ncbi:hypothetical protein ABZP36_024771 [Zizania latifolia]